MFAHIDLLWRRCGRSRLGPVSNQLRTSLLLNCASFSPIHTTVPPVLHCIIAPVTESPGNFGPSLAHFLHKLLNHLSLLCRDRFVIKGWFEILVISLSTLLRRSMLHVLRYADPIVGTLSADEVQERGIFLW